MKNTDHYKSHLILLLHTKKYIYHIDPLAAKRLARGARGKGSGGPAVGLALGPCAQSADCHGAGDVDFNGAAPR